ncbi:hypothetical protein C8Q78DRAFT_569524 [Trametes maxima]|nr:hypothetical protein C8Q78DRAFT_569524 [Trametes maxima]
MAWLDETFCALSYLHTPPMDCAAIELCCATHLASGRRCQADTQEDFSESGQHRAGQLRRPVTKDPTQATLSTGRSFVTSRWVRRVVKLTISPTKSASNSSTFRTSTSIQTMHNQDRDEPITSQAFSHSHYHIARTLCHATRPSLKEDHPPLFILSEKLLTSLFCILPRQQKPPCPQTPTPSPRNQPFGYLIVPVSPQSRRLVAAHVQHSDYSFLSRVCLPTTNPAFPIRFPSGIANDHRLALAAVLTTARPKR